MVCAYKKIDEILGKSWGDFGLQDVGEKTKKKKEISPRSDQDHPEISKVFLLASLEEKIFFASVWGKKIAL